MASYLDSYVLSVGEGQARGILRLIESMRNSGVIKNDAELKLVVEELRKLVTGRVNFEPVADPVRIRSTDINKNFEQIFVDLYGLYTNIERMSNTVKSQQVVASGLRQNVKKIIQRVSQDVLQFLFLRDNPEYTEAKYIDFTDTRNLSTARTKAVVEPHSRTLRLPPVRQDRHNEIRGLEATTITTEILTNNTQSAVTKTLAPENALDQDETSFWAEVVLADEIVKTTFEDADGNDTTVDGVVVKVTISFERPQFVNNVQILPFSPYPLTILDVRFDGVSWDGFSEQTPTFEWIDFTGTRSVAETVEIFFQQPNYSLVNYLVPEWAYHNAVLWQSIISRELEDADFADAEIGLDVRDVLETPTTAALLKARTKFKNILSEVASSTFDQAKRVTRIVDAIAEVMDSTTVPVLASIGNVSDSVDHTKLVEIDKVQYTLGAYSIVASDIEYASAAEYVSQPFALRGNLLDVDLEVDQLQSEDEDGFPLTSTEFDLVLGPNNIYPVLPTGVAVVQQEYLNVDVSSRTAKLRFDAFGDVDIYPNLGIPITVSPTANKYVAIPSGSYDPDVMYTANYVPQTGQQVLDVEDLLDSTPTIDIVSSTDPDGGIQLQYYPHIVYPIVNDIERWNREDPERGVWRIDPTGVAVNHDGVSYGFAESPLSAPISSSATSISILSASAFPTEGKLYIEDEIVSYSGKSGNTLTPCVRGVDHSVPASHASLTPVTLVTSPQYEPVRVYVNGAAARNITDYRTREHPAFSSRQEGDNNYQFIQIGRKVYLNKPISNGTIEIAYNYKAEYIALRAILRSHQLGTVSRTPIVNRYSIRMKSETP